METRSSPNIQALHSLAREAGIPDYETLPKGILYRKIQEQFNLDRLQRVESRRKRVEAKSNKRCHDADGDYDEMDRSQGGCSSSSSSSSSSQSHSGDTKKARVVRRLNKLDPIMFAPIKKRHTWKFVRPNGSAVVFNIETLVDFILATGDFTDPETRLPFSDDDLQQIDVMAKKAGLNKQSVYETKQNPRAFDDLKFRRDALQGLERCAGEVVTDMLTIIEEFDPEEAQMRLVMRELPTFADYYRQLSDADPAFARQCMVHWKTFLVGPPNRPNEDPYGLLDTICSYLDVCEQYTVSGQAQAAIVRQQAQQQQQQDQNIVQHPEIEGQGQP